MVRGASTAPPRRCQSGHLHTGEDHARARATEMGCGTISPKAPNSRNASSDKSSSTDDSIPPRRAFGGRLCSAFGRRLSQIIRLIPSFFFTKKEPTRHFVERRTEHNHNMKKWCNKCPRAFPSFRRCGSQWGVGSSALLSPSSGLLSICCSLCQEATRHRRKHKHATCRPHVALADAQLRKRVLRHVVRPTSIGRPRLQKRSNNFITIEVPKHRNNAANPLQTFRLRSGGRSRGRPASSQVDCSGGEAVQRRDRLPISL